MAADSYRPMTMLAGGALSALPGGLPPAAPARRTGPGRAQPQTAGPQTAGPQTAGPQTAGPQTAGPQTAGPQTAGPRDGADGRPAEAAGPRPVQGVPQARTAGPPVPAVHAVHAVPAGAAGDDEPG